MICKKERKKIIKIRNNRLKLFASNGRTLGNNLNATFDNLCETWQGGFYCIFFCQGFYSFSLKDLELYWFI